MPRHAPAAEYDALSDRKVGRGDDVQQETIYRKEALENRLRTSGYGEPLVASPRWVGAGFWLLLAGVVVVAGIAAGRTVDDRTVAPALVDLSTGAAGVALPEDVGGRLAPGTDVFLSLSGGRSSIPARVAARDGEVANDELLAEWRRLMTGEPHLLELELGPRPVEHAAGIVAGELVVPVEEDLLDILLPWREGAFRG